MDQKGIETLDQEWVSLIVEALEMGISKEEIKDFLLEHAVNNI
ncbi:anti-repressor SinI family protein [Salinibacillus xinjiangensis]|uniref:DNA-binding anti-repressor SinI n=1 Tax=Salinibacillus xinjiangensis TaxID=1229268 RepID=A0A6G1X8U9_9BACI|nr:anti-repressor SinI family protein [Salinibacillus xinjiangensis]MRG87431.1 DNA-binding anti-repressor SinI [Salinibacillus xinjiangensis]